MNNSVFNSTKLEKILIKNSKCDQLQARGTHFKDVNLSNNNFTKCDLNRSTFESGKFINLNFQECKMFMFFCFKIFFQEVNFKSSNLTLAKIINCEKINTSFNRNNKMLCFFEKNDTRFNT